MLADEHTPGLCGGDAATKRGFYRWDCAACCATFLLGEPRLVVRQEVLDYLKKKEPGLASRAKELVVANWQDRRFRKSL